MTDLKDSIEQFKKKVAILKDRENNTSHVAQEIVHEEKVSEAENKVDDTLHEIVGTTKSTFEILKKWGVDVIAVYFFVFYTAKRQKTNKAKATVSFIAKGLCITEARVRKAKNYLKKHNLIKDEVRKDSKWKIKWWYITLNYMFKISTLTNFHRVDFWDTNAYKDKIKMLKGKNSNNIISITKASLCYEDFKFLEEYRKSYIQRYKEIEGNSEAQNICAIFNYKRSLEWIYSYTKLYFWLCDELELCPVASITEINFLAQLRWQFKIEQYEDFKRLLLKLHYINGKSSYYLYTISEDVNPEEKDFEKLTKKEIGHLIKTLEDYEDMREFLINNRNYIMSWDYYFEDEDTE